MIPAAPNAPTVVKDCSVAAITVTAPAFPAGATSLLVQREVTIGLATTQDTPPSFVAPGTYTDNNLLPTASYRYRCMAHNEDGDSTWGPWSASITLQSANSIAFESPAAGITLRRLDQVVVRVSGALALAASDPVEVRFNGTVIPVTPAPGDARQFFAALPHDLGEWQGPVHLTAQTTDINGCRSAITTRTVYIYSTILDDTRWGDLRIEEDSPIDSVQVDVFLDLSEETSDYTYEFAVASPPPTLSPPPSEPTSEQQKTLESDWLLMQKITISADEPLLGLRSNDGSYQSPTNIAICRIRAARKWKTTRFPMDAPLTKARAVGTGEYLFYALPYIYRFSASGWEKIVDLSAAQLHLDDVATDAILRGSKCLVVADGRFIAVDLDTANDVDGVDISTIDSPLGETKPAKWIENLAPDTVGGITSWVRIFGDGENSTLYESWVGLDGIETRKRWTLAHPITHFYAWANKVAFVAGNEIIYTWERGQAAPVLKRVHSFDVTFVRESEEFGLLFGDVTGGLYSVPIFGDASLWAMWDLRNFPLRAACHFKGDGDELFLVDGGDNQQVFFQGYNVNGVFLARLTLDISERVLGLERFETTVVPVVGDPLNGGTPAVIVDNLLVAVTGDEGSYLLRYQQRERSPLAIDAAGIGHIEFSATLGRIAPTLPEEELEE